jgi:hypothetical protein
VIGTLLLALVFSFPGVQRNPSLNTPVRRDENDTFATQPA